MFGIGGIKKVITDEAKIDELLTRGVAEVIDKDELKKKLLSGKSLRVKLGIDPTSPDIHLGRSVLLLKLRDFQELGHQVVLIIGDATGVIGDTSDKESERPMLTKESVEENSKNYFRQAGKILELRSVEKKYNSEWLSKLSYSEIGEQANHFSLAEFIARDNIKKRLDGGKRVSLRETLYPLMQGYDSVAIEADVEIGGTDQRFNLLAGRTMQSNYNQEPQQVLTTNLIEGIDGRKMSSSWGNTIKLTDEANNMYGKVMRLNDESIETYFVHATRVPLDDVKSHMNSGPRNAKGVLAHTIVEMYWGEADADTAERTFVETFSEGGIPDDIEKVNAKDVEYISDVLLRSDVVKSKNEFARLVGAGAITNLTTNNKVDDIKANVGSGGVFKIGKKKFIEIKVS